MGLMDKIKTDIKNVDNRLGQSVDSAKFDSKISDQKNDKKKAIQEAGEKMYAAYLEGKTEICDEAKALFDKAKACDDEIAKLEAEKAEMIEKAKAERENNKNSA